jgi:hypothetical protein
MKKIIIRSLLWILNSRWLNASPCRYGFINNVEAFDFDYLISEERQRPGLTVQTVLAEARLFQSCPLQRNGLTVIEGGVIREGTPEDIEDLKRSLEQR